MDKEKAIKILDEVIPPPEHYMVDLDHLQIAQAWACIKEMLTANTIKLSTGEYYKPKKGEYPVCPCDECKDRNSAKWAACNAGLGVCAAYMDYEHMKAVYRLTVFE